MQENTMEYNTKVQKKVAGDTKNKIGEKQHSQNSMGRSSGLPLWTLYVW